MRAVEPVLALRTTRLLVEPGSQTSTAATVRNPGTIVEQYELSVLGAGAGWTEVVPQLLSLAPGAQADVQLVFRPPLRSSTPAGQVPFGLRVVSREDPERCDVAEGDLTVGAIIDLDAQLVPEAPRGAFSGRYRVVFRNGGSVPLDLRLTVEEPEKTLGFALAPEELEVAPAEEGEAFLKVRARSPFPLGAPRTRAFTLAYQQEGGRPDGDVRPGILTGSFEQRPILSRLVTMVALVVVLVAGAIIFLALRGGAARPQPGAPPPAPELAAAAGVGADRIQLQWSASALVTDYRVQRLLPGAAGDDPAVEEQRDLAGDLGVYTWTELPPGSEHCFRLVAANSAGDSLPSASRCAATLAAAAFGPPTGLEATPAEGLQVQLRWVPASADAVHTIFVDGTRLSEAQPGATSATITVLSPGERCFSLIAQAGDQASAASEERCVTVAAPQSASPAATAGDTGSGGTEPGGASPDASASPTGAGTEASPGASPDAPAVPGGAGTATPSAPAVPEATTDEIDGFYVIYAAYPVDDLVYQDIAVRRLSELQALGVPAKLADSRTSEVLSDGFSGLWYLYDDGLASREAAQEHCAQFRDRTPCAVP